jgi:predicted AAA+ superfamily ATPase
VNTLRRLGGKGGEPVIQMKTGFGGGKTHGLIALFHLINGASTLLSLPADGKYASLNTEIRGLMQESEWGAVDGIDAKISVLDGSSLSTTDKDRTKTGDPLNTLWGKMADQLGGQYAYDIIGEAARQGISPGGNQLNQLFDFVGPSVILIDELVAYARNVQVVTRESIFTFIHNLTLAVNRSENIALVITLPESKAEAGGDDGVRVLHTLETILERIEDVWEPLAVNESFEVVRRRLFWSEIDTVERDRTCDAYFQRYRSARSHFPVEVADSNYLERMRACYPIHPEIFDRLFQDWSMIHEFQRTRGVLRITATCISRLYQDEDPSPMIMPADLRFDHPSLADEFSKLLEKRGGTWKPVLTEVDGDDSRTHHIDKASKNFLEVGGAARRIARTVFLGSAATHAVRGISTRHIHLGTVVPGQGVGTYNDALNRMNGSLYYLYNLDDRYYFDAEANLNQVAQARGVELTIKDIRDEIVNRLEKAVGRRSDVQVCPTSPSSVPDAGKLQLVILPPHVSLPSRTEELDTAETEAVKILRYSGDENQQRGFRNTVLFLTAKRDAVRDLENHVRRYLAWYSIVHGNSLHSAIQGLKEERLKQANENLKSASDQVKTALSKAYRWTLAPSQPDPQRDEYVISLAQTNPEDGRIVQHALDKFAEDEAIIKKITPSLFASVLQQYIWSNAAYQDHIGLETLWELMARHVYMPRMKDIEVLKTCISEGVASSEFGYADSYEGEIYRGLKLGESLPSARIIEGISSVLISPDMANLQREEKQPDPTETLPPEPKPKPGTVPDLPPETGSGTVPSSGPRHVVITKTLREISLDDIDALRDEIVRTLSDDGGEVSVKIIITADKSEGFSENAARAIKQNSEHLGAEVRTD